MNHLNASLTPTPNPNTASTRACTPPPLSGVKGPCPLTPRASVSQAPKGRSLKEHAVAGQSCSGTLRRRSAKARAIFFSGHCRLLTVIQSQPRVLSSLNPLSAALWFESVGKASVCRQPDCSLHPSESGPITNMSLQTYPLTKKTTKRKRDTNDYLL